MAFFFFHANQPVFCGVCCLNQGLHRDNMSHACSCVFAVVTSVHVCRTVCAGAGVHISAVCMLDSYCCVLRALVGGAMGQLCEHSC